MTSRQVAARGEMRGHRAAARSGTRTTRTPICAGQRSTQRSTGTSSYRDRPYWTADAASASRAAVRRGPTAGGCLARKELRNRGGYDVAHRSDLGAEASHLLGGELGIRSAASGSVRCWHLRVSRLVVPARGSRVRLPANAGHRTAAGAVAADTMAAGWPRSACTRTPLRQRLPARVRVVPRLLRCLRSLACGIDQRAPARPSLLWPGA